jgi:hypothetical protein
MNDSEQTVYDFSTFLDNPNPELLSDEVKTGLKQLQNEFKTLPKQLTIIVNAILNWCEQYPEIDRCFTKTDGPKFRCDMIEEGKEKEVTPPDITLDVELVTNKMIIAIDKINRENESSDRSNDTKDNDPND